VQAHFNTALPDGVSVPARQGKTTWADVISEEDQLVEDDDRLGDF
jgi:hypothetical protein